MATGAAVACPGRPVLALEADGSAMYTLSALWTHASEGLDITTVIFNNRSYAILNMELNRVGARRPGTPPATCSSCPGPISTSWRWPTGWASRPAEPARAGEFGAQLQQALAEPGPHLIEALIERIG